MLNRNKEGNKRVNEQLNEVLAKCEFNEKLDGRQFHGRKHIKVDVAINLEKEILRDGKIRVVGQADNKFILCILVQQNLLIAFDQHAVHERIRFEQFMDNAFDTNGKLKSTLVLPPIVINQHFDDNINNSIIKHKDKIMDVVAFDIKVGLQTNEYVISQIPTCLKDSLNVETIVEIIKEAVVLIEDINCKHIKLTPKLLEKLQSQACHGAIRFGDSLKLHDCKTLITALSKCKQCFQCAHGRPSFAPLLFLPE